MTATDRRTGLVLDHALLNAVERIAEPLQHMAPTPGRDSAIAAQCFAEARRLDCPDLGEPLRREVMARLSRTT